MFTLRLGCFEVGGEGVGVVGGSKTLIEPLAGAEVEEGITGPKHLVDEKILECQCPWYNPCIKAFNWRLFRIFTL